MTPALLPALPAPPAPPAPTVGMAMLSTGGGSSTLAMALGHELGERGLAVRYCHCDAQAARPLAGAAVLTADPAAHTASLLDVDRALVGGIDAASQILRWHDAARFDLLHLHSLQAFGVPAALLRQLRGVPYVVTLHGSDVLSGHLMDANLPVVRALLAGAAAVTCVSAFLARELARKIPGLDALVVHNFLAPELRGAPPAPAAGASGPRPAAHYLHVSSLRDVKRPELLFAAFARLRRAHPAARLTVVSTHRGLARAADLLPAYDLDGAVTLASGDAGPDALVPLYRQATALVLTSRFESFGLVILEALAHGLPVVVPAVGGIPEVVGDDWPLLVRAVDDPDAYAAAMLAAGNGAAPAVAAAMRDLAPRVLDRFAPRRQVERYLGVYRRALAAER